MNFFYNLGTKMTQFCGNSFDDDGSSNVDGNGCGDCGGGLLHEVS